MGALAELLATGDREALEFFFLRLRDVSGSTVDQQELLYNASVLAHYALVSTQSQTDLPAPATLSAVFDQFVLDSGPLSDGALMESAGAQCLVLTGFFQDQMRRRHDIRWYADLGAGFFRRAASQARVPHKGRLLSAIAAGFEVWRQRYVRLSRDLRDQPYLLAQRPPDRR